jgi:hypothetical protein
MRSHLTNKRVVTGTGAGLRTRFPVAAGGLVVGLANVAGRRIAARFGPMPPA